MNLHPAQVGGLNKSNNKHHQKITNLLMVEYLGVCLSKKWGLGPMVRQKGPAHTQERNKREKKGEKEKRWGTGRERKESQDAPQ